MKDFLEPIAMKKGDARVYINGETCKVDFRIISESNYQLVMDRIKSLEDALQAVIDDISAPYGFDAKRIPNESVKKALELITKNLTH